MVIDVMGNFRAELPSEFRFCFVLADQNTKFVFVEFLKAKNEALASMKKFLLSVETRKKLRQNNTKELLPEQFKIYYIDAGILVMIKWGKVIQTGLVKTTTENERRLILQAQRTFQLGCQDAGHSCSFNIRSRIWGHGSSSLRRIASETTSGGFWHPTETSNSNWKGQSDCYQIVPKPSQAQSEQVQWDQISFHSGQDRRWNYFNSLRSYRKNGGRNH